MGRQQSTILLKGQERQGHRRGRMKRCKRQGCPNKVAIPATGRRPSYCSHACRQAAYHKRHRPLKGSQAVLTSSRTDEWATPQWFFDELDAEFGPFDLDPCATPENAKCPAFFTREQDGLAQRWWGRTFLNPPYGKPIARWLKKALESVESGDAEIVVCLLPAKTGTRWWHEWAMKGEVRLLRGRLKYGKANNDAPFSSAVVVFRQSQDGGQRLTKLAPAGAPDAA
jgi:phage N-6-adenine-methyltransferase